MGAAIVLVLFILLVIILLSSRRRGSYSSLRQDPNTVIGEPHKAEIIF
ncbi:hypothetical protein VQL36_13420 [Chengkuizengella sp. SCS-71B]